MALKFKQPSVEPSAPVEVQVPLKPDHTALVNYYLRKYAAAVRETRQLDKQFFALKEQMLGENVEAQTIQERLRTLGREANKLEGKIKELLYHCIKRTVSAGGAVAKFSNPKTGEVDGAALLQLCPEAFTLPGLCSVDPKKFKEYVAAKKIPKDVAAAVYRDRPLTQNGRVGLSVSLD